MENSPLICSANQWTGFYMITASVMKELMRFYEKPLQDTLTFGKVFHKPRNIYFFHTIPTEICCIKNDFVETNDYLSNQHAWHGEKNGSSEPVYKNKNLLTK